MLFRSTIEDVTEAAAMIEMLMGDKVEGRKEFLATNANFNKVDGFIDRVRFKPESDSEVY